VDIQLLCIISYHPLICLSYTEFGLAYAADEQTFCAITQWHCLSAKPTLHSTWSWHMRRVICQAIRANNREGGLTLKELWKAVNNIGDSWTEIKDIQNAGLLDEVIPRIGAGF